MKRIRVTKEEPKKEFVQLATSASPSGTVDKRSIAIESKDKRREAVVTKDQLEALFRLDGLTFRIVRKYVEKMVGNGYLIQGGSNEGRQLCQEFADDVDLKSVLSVVIQDIFVTGNGTGWLELGYTKDGTDIVAVRLINPKSDIGFRKDADKNVIYDNTLRPEAINLGGKLGFPVMSWEENAIVKGNQVVWTPSNDNEDGRDRIAYFKLIDVGEDEEGLSPLEPVYKAALIRLNLEDTVGNAAFRGSAVAAYVGLEGGNPLEITDEMLNDVKDKLLQVDQDTVWAFRRDVALENFPQPEIDKFERLMYYFADMQSSGSGIGISLILQPLDRGFRGDVSVAKEEFLDSVTLYQDLLAKQVRDQLFKRLMKAKGKDPRKAPYIKFKSKDSGIALSQSRRLSTYARYKLLTPDTDLETWIRDNEGLPHKPEGSEPVVDEEETNEDE